MWNLDWSGIRDLEHGTVAGARCIKFGSAKNEFGPRGILERTGLASKTRTAETLERRNPIVLPESTLYRI